MKKRKIISAAIILSGLALFLVILNLPSRNAPKPLSVEGGGTYDSGFQYKTSQDRDSFANPTQASGELSAGDNLTETLANSFSQGVFEANGGIAQGEKNPQVALPNSDAVTSAINQSMEQNIQFPVFSEKDIRIINDNSAAAQTAYLESLGKISEENFNGFKTPMPSILDEFFNKNNPTKLSKYVAIAENQITDLLALKVPQRFSAWHLQNLNLWNKKVVIYKAILGMDADPLKAIIAMKQVNDALQENSNLQKIINDLATQ